MSRRLRRHGPALLALFLWVPTAALLGWLLLAQGPAESDDPRQVITVGPAEAAVISEVMRHNLRGYQGVLDAAGRGDLAAVARVARETADSPGPARASEALDATLPRQWRLMGRQVHDGFRALATAAEQPDGAAQVAPHLAEITAACLACHDTYRLEVVR